MKYINRHLEDRILELSKSYSAILLTGPRQAGKTTMLQELAEKENIGREYVTLDDLTERDNRRCLSTRCNMRRSCSHI